MDGKPVLNFSQQFDFNIWKIHAFRESPYIILELRDQDTLQVSFTLFDLGVNKIIKEGIVLDEAWWVTVEFATEGEIVFQRFEATHDPEKRSYIGYSLLSSKVDWESPEFDLTKHVRSGELQNNHLEMPFHYPEGSEYFQTVEKFVRTYFDKSISKAVDYLEKGSLIFISYFVEQSPILANYLLVIDRKMDILLHEKLGEFDRGITDNTFFIINNKLIFVKGTTDFFIYDLML